MSLDIRVPIFLFVFLFSLNLAWFKFFLPCNNFITVDLIFKAFMSSIVGPLFYIYLVKSDI